MLSLLSGSFAKETYDLKEPTNRSHPIYIICRNYLYNWIGIYILLWVYYIYCYECIIYVYTVSMSVLIRIGNYECFI